MLKFLENVWLCVAIAAAVLTVYSMFAPDMKRYDIVWFTIITIVAGGMYFVRRKQRLGSDKSKLR